MRPLLVRTGRVHDSQPSGRGRVLATGVPAAATAAPPGDAPRPPAARPRADVLAGSVVVQAHPRAD